jgi:hypothetical protein
VNKDGDNHGDADNVINDGMMISYLLIDDDTTVSLI